MRWLFVSLPMRFFLVAAVVTSLHISAFAQEQLLGKTKSEALAQISYQTVQPVEGKRYPLIKETIKLEGIQDWNNVSTAYIFFDSSDRVCRLHLIYERLTLEEKQKISAELMGQAKHSQDLSDKKHTTTTWQTKGADYLLTWAKDRNRPAAYLLVTDPGYKRRMLNYLVNGGSLPDDGIFTPAPSK